MAIALVSETNGGAIRLSAEDASISKPATVNDNDILVVFLEGKVGGIGTYDAGSSWIDYQLRSTVGNDIYTGIFYRTVPDASALTGTFVFIGSVVQTYAFWCGALSGVDLVNPEDVSFASKWKNFQNDSSPNLTSYNTVTDGAFAYACLAINNDGAITLPGGIWGTENINNIFTLNVVSALFPNSGTATGTDEFTDVSATAESNAGTFIFRPSSAQSAEATPSLASITIQGVSPAIKITRSAIASPSVASLTVLVNTHVASVKTVAGPSNANISLDVPSPVTQINTVASPSASSVSVNAQSPTIKITKSATASPSIASVTVQVVTPSVTSGKGATATPSVANITVSAVSPTIRIARSATATCSVAVITITVPTPTVTVSGGAGTITIRIVLKSEIKKDFLFESPVNNRLRKKSRIDKFMNLESTMINA